MEHHAYSNIALAVHFSVAPEGPSRLSAELEHRGIALAPESESRLEAARPAGGVTDDADLVASLSLRFIHGEPDLRRRVPPIPG